MVIPPQQAELRWVWDKYMELLQLSAAGAPLRRHLLYATHRALSSGSDVQTEALLRQLLGSSQVPCHIRERMPY